MPFAALSTFYISLTRAHTHRVAFPRLSTADIATMSVFSYLFSFDGHTHVNHNYSDFGW